MEERQAYLVAKTAIGICTLAMQLTAANFWVSGTGDDVTGDGSVGSPFRTISRAMVAATGGDTIKVLSGDYNVAAGEDFPIDIKNNVDILGQEEDEEDWPRIGGDVQNTDVEALLRVPVSVSSRVDMDVKNLWFVGEDSAGEDGPSALLVRVSGGYTARLNFEDNYCERPEMNDGVLDNNRPTISIEGGRGTTNVTIINCQGIEPSRLGGVVVKNGTDTTSTSPAIIQVTLRQNAIVLTSNELPARYGFAFLAKGEEWVEGRLAVRGNLIDSILGAGHGGIDYGASIELEPEGSGEIRVTEEYFEFTANSVLGHLQGAALRLRAVPTSSTAVAELSLTNFERNELRGLNQYGRTGYGVSIERSDLDGQYAGFVEVRSHGNMIVENSWGVGVVDDVGGSGLIHLVNDTIAGCQAQGLALLGDDAWIDSLANGIVWGNNFGGAQYDAGTTSWAPDNSATWGWITEFCNFQGSSGFSGGEENLDSDPLFVNASSGDFHLSSSSPCIDQGDNVPDNGVALAEFDIDGQGRVDLTTPRLVDMGADEYHP